MINLLIESAASGSGTACHQRGVPVDMKILNFSFYRYKFDSDRTENAQYFRLVSHTTISACKYALTSDQAVKRLDVAL
jgi:hypothetical protein